MNSALYDVNWTDFMNNNAQFLTQQQRELVIGVSGYHSINPLVLIDELMVEEESDLDALKLSDQAFLEHLTELANATERLYEDMETVSEKPKSNSATSALWNVYEKDDTKLDNFINNYQKLFDKTGLSHEDFNYNSNDDVENRQWNGLQWPWKGSVLTGACHGNTGRGWIASALDPQDGARWGHLTPNRLQPPIVAASG